MVPLVFLSDMTKILITGVAGLIGSRLADWLIDNVPQIHIIGVDDLSGGYIDNVHPKVEFHKLDISKESLDHIFSKNIDYVYHFAAYAAECLSPFIREFNYTNNLVATSRVVNYCIKYSVKRLVFTSTIGVYGYGNPPFSEDHQPQPIDPYGIAKYACELDIQNAGSQHGLDWCIIRPHNVYGIKQNIWDKYRNVLGIWMYQYLNDEPMTIFGDGEQVRAFSYIDDSLETFWKTAVSAEASKQVFNIGGSKLITINEANTILREVVGGGKISYLEPRLEVKYAHPICQKAMQVLDHKEKTCLKEGLTKMWEWAKIQPIRNRFVWNKYEIENKIYSYWKL